MNKVFRAIRNALGIRKRRRLPPRSPQPVPGAKIVKGTLRMDVVEGMSPELWAWLLNLGWRKAMLRNDRRRYEEIPKEWAAELTHLPAEQWEKTLTSGIAAARGKGPLLPPPRIQATGWNAPDRQYLSDADRIV